jgi:hypothetical protein
MAGGGNILAAKAHQNAPQLEKRSERKRPRHSKFQRNHKASVSSTTANQLNKSLTGEMKSKHGAAGLQVDENERPKLSRSAAPIRIPGNESLLRARRHAWENNTNLSSRL